MNPHDVAWLYAAVIWVFIALPLACWLAHRSH